MVLDKIDLKILYHLDYNARLSLTKLHKKVGISVQNLNYRIKRLKNEGIIEKYVSVIDVHRLGFLTYRAYFRLGKVTNKDLEEVTKHLQNNPTILWLVSITGNWDFEIVFVAKNYIEFEKLFGSVKQKLGDRLIKYNLSM